IDFGKSDEGLLFLVLEYLEGCDLEHMLAERGALPLEETIDLLLQAIEAVAEAHSNGIVHRDLKPGNLFVTRDVYGCPCIKVLDFGISKLVDAETELKATAASAVMGTPVYMPPEQMRGAHAADHRADIWALGTILYECLTGKAAWSGATLNEVCVRVATDPTPSVRALVPSTPPAVDAIVERCLRKDPAERYQSVLELGEALAKLLPEIGRPAMSRVYHLVRNDLPQNDRAGINGAGSVGYLGGRTSTAWGEQTRVRPLTRRFRLPPLLRRTAPALLLLVTGGLAGTWWRWSDYRTGKAPLIRELMTAPTPVFVTEIARTYSEPNLGQNVSVGAPPVSETTGVESVSERKRSPSETTAHPVEDASETDNGGAKPAEKAKDDVRSNTGKVPLLARQQMARLRQPALKGSPPIKQRKFQVSSAAPNTTLDTVSDPTIPNAPVTPPMANSVPAPSVDNAAPTPPINNPPPAPSDPASAPSNPAPAGNESDGSVTPDWGGRR
ncbi:MAG TPA: serine/threonine-protein kinase, partial [Polyangiaceae bacterium]|nr:serine/threonine-protein kinase [Polyangiaceae bacterium]